MGLTERVVEMNQAERDKLRKLTRSAPIRLLIQAVFAAGVLWLILDDFKASRMFNTVFVLIFVVSFSRWKSVEVNQLVELHIAVFSEHIFGVYSVENE